MIIFSMNTLFQYIAVYKIVPIFLQMCMFSDRSDCVDNVATNVTNVDGDDAIFILGGVLKRESWVLPMLVLSAINVTVILAFEVFVVCKAARSV